MFEGVPAPENSQTGQRVLIQRGFLRDTENVSIDATVKSHPQFPIQNCRLAVVSKACGRIVVGSQCNQSR